MKGFFYRVQEEDSLFALSRRFGVPPVLLAKENKLNTEIETGDIVWIPPVPERTYRTTVTDTAETLALRFSRSASEILEENGIDYIFPFLVLSV